MQDRNAIALKSQIGAMKAELFEVGIFDSLQDMMLIREWDFQKVLESLKELRAHNVKGKHIYIRPAGEHALSLIDDLTEDGINRMKADGFNPAVLIETSPNNFQAWVNHGERLPTAISTECAQELARRYGGDPSSADWRHFGRLAGFTNRKEKYRQPNGYFPFVRLHRSTGEVYAKASAFIQAAHEAVAKREIEEAERREKWRNMLAPVSHGALKSINDFRNDPRYGGDYHRADIGYAVYAISRGVSADAIAVAIRTRDLSHKGSEIRQHDYIDRTIEKAADFAKTQHRSTTR